MEIDHEIIFYGHSPTPSADSWRAVVSYWRKCVHKYWLNAWRTKPVQEKCEKINWSAPHDLNNVDWVR